MDEPVLPTDFFKTSPWTAQDFHSLVEIGKGKDTIIYCAVCPKLGNKKVAVKVYDKHKVQPTKYRAIKREIAMMMFFSSKRLPYCCKYYGAFHDAEHIYVIMEYCGGGDLLEKLLKDKKAMNEKKVAVEVAIPMLSVIQHLHAMKIIHRDIKLENIFIDDAGQVKMGDFGLTMSMKQESAISPVGTVEYMAPEVVALPPVDLVVSGQIKAQEIQPTNEKVDIWALGVTLYELVTGRLPFEGKDKVEIKRNISNNNLAGFPSYLTPQCQTFIRAMLTYDPAERPSAEALLAHPYITMYNSTNKPGLLSNVISLQAFTPGLGGVAPAGDPGTPRTPGGSTVGFHVQKGRPATTMATPIAARAPIPGGAFNSFESDFEGQQLRASSVRSKGSLLSFGKGVANKGRGSLVEHSGGMEEHTRRAQSWTAPKGYQPVSQPGTISAGGSVVQGLKSTLKKIFARRSTHQRLEDMVIDQSGSPGCPASTSFT